MWVRHKNASPGNERTGDVEIGKWNKDEEEEDDDEVEIEMEMAMAAMVIKMMRFIVIVSVESLWREEERLALPRHSALRACAKRFSFSVTCTWTKYRQQSSSVKTSDGAKRSNFSSKDHWMYIVNTHCSNSRKFATCCGEKKNR